MSEGLELGDESFGDAFGVAFAEVGAAEVGVELAGSEHVPARDQDRVLDCAECFHVAAAGLSGRMRLEVDVVGAGRGDGGFVERPVEPLGGFAGRAGAAFAGGLVVAGAHPGPAGEVLVGREDRHADADLGDDHLGGTLLNAGDRAQEFNGLLERGDVLGGRVAETGDLPDEEVDVIKDRVDPHRVEMIEAALERFFERGDLCAHPATGELGEDLGVGGAFDERVEHRAPGLPQDVCGDAVELDPGVLQRLVQPVGSRARSWIWVFRYRVRFRNARIGLGGTKPACA